MNYFELYPGDYLRDTGRLSMLDHGAYLRLMLEYYAVEQPLPADLSELYIITAAITAADKAAVKKVAERFFPIAEDGLRHNGRADNEIAKAQMRMAISRENGAKGGRPKKPRENPAGNPVGFENPGFEKPKHNPAKTHSGEALQTPHAIHTPEASLGADRSLTARALEPPDASAPGADPPAAGVACLAMRRGGLATVNPSHPQLLAALAEGATPAQFEHTAREAVELGKGFAWTLATLRGRLADAARPPPPGAPHGPHRQQPRLSAVDRVVANIQRAQSLDQAADEPDPNAIPGQAVRLPR